MQTGEKGVLVQEFTQYPGTQFTTAGEAWRQIRNWWIIPIGGAIILFVVLAVALYYKFKGPIGAHVAPHRAPDRALHLPRARPALDHRDHLRDPRGLGRRDVVRQVLPAADHGRPAVRLDDLVRSRRCTTSSARVFAVSMIVMFFVYLPSNWPTRADWAWLKRAGGMLGGAAPALAPLQRRREDRLLGRHAGARRGGRRLPGFALDMILPGLDLTRPQMQVAHIFHAIASLLMIAHVHRPRLHGHDRRERLVPGDEDRLCRRGLGARSTIRSGATTSSPARSRRSASRTPSAAAGRRAAGGLKPLRPRKAMRPVHCAALLSAGARPAGAGQAAGAVRRSQGRRRRDRRQGGLGRQGRRLQALPVAGPRRRRLSQERQGARGLGRGRPAPRRRRRPAPIPAPMSPRTPAASKPLEAAGAHSPPGTATSPPSTNATSAQIAAEEVAPWPLPGRPAQASPPLRTVAGCVPPSD